MTNAGPATAADKTKRIWEPRRLGKKSFYDVFNEEISFEKKETVKKSSPLSESEILVSQEKKTAGSSVSTLPKGKVHTQDTMKPASAAMPRVTPRPRSAHSVASKTYSGDMLQLNRHYKEKVASKAESVPHTAVSQEQKQTAMSRAVAVPKVKKSFDGTLTMQKKTRQIPFGMIFGTLIAMILLLFIAFNMAMMNDMKTDISNCKKEISAAMEEKDKLSFELEQKNDLRVIDQMATEMGMVKKSQLQVYYVVNEDMEKIEAFLPEEKEDIGLSTILSTFRSNFGDLLEYLGKN